MNLAHLHLLINHLPILGSVLGGLVLAYAIFMRSVQIKIVSYYLLIISSLGAAIAYATGEEAEEAVENIQGVSKDMIEQHDDFAMISLIALVILGVASFVGLVLTFKNSVQTRNMAFVTLFISIISFCLVARTGYLGGQIRHSEMSSGSATQQNGGGDEDRD